MSETDVIKYISDNMVNFSKRQRQLAEFILDHLDKAAYMTALQLGKAAGVSESTSVRFAAELGFGRYHDFQKSMREAARNQLNSMQRMEIATERIGNDDVLSSVLKSDVEKILVTLNEIDRAQFSAAVDTLLKAENISKTFSSRSPEAARNISAAFGIVSQIAPYWISASFTGA